ncbi:MAG: hypothetical protein AB7F28_08315 [Candidatus Margulisiibacteriota bacterium]
MKYKYSLALVTGVMCVTTSLMAADLAVFSARKEAMGGVGVAVSNDESALYQNPAALAKVKGFKVKLPKVLGAFNTTFTDKNSQLQDFLNAKSDAGAQLTNLKALVPNTFASRVALNPGLSVTMPGFGVGLFGGLDVLAKLSNPVFPELHVEGHTDIFPSVGFAGDYEFFDMPMSLGISAKYVIRQTMYNKASGADTFIVQSNDLMKLVNNASDKPEISTYTTQGIGIDLGMLTPMDNLLGKGQWGVSLRNVLGTLGGSKDITGAGSQSVTQTLPVVGAVGFAAETRLPSWVPLVSDVIGDFTWAADYQLISPDTSFFKKTHVGVEKSVLFDIVKLRSGLNQGYITAGLGVDVWLVKFNYAYFAEELGPEIGMEPLKTHVFDLTFFF